MGKQRGGSKTDMIVKLALVVFISLLSFSVGTYVGKQVSDAENKRVTLEDGHGTDRHVASSSDHHEEGGALSEEEIASLQEEFLSDEKSDSAAHEGSHATASTHEEHKTTEDGYSHYGKKGDTPASESHHETAANDHVEPARDMHSTTSSDHAQREVASEKTEQHAMANSHDSHVKHEVAKPAERVALGKAPVEDPKKRHITSTLPTDPITAAAGKYTVQVASYGTEDEAKSHAASLMKKGYSAFYIPATVRGQNWYRVSVGLYSDQKKAMAFQNELKTQAGVTSSIVQRIEK
ncbi:MAG: SPOR domain-containing protein [Pseudobdellovibrionaceae bacterium]|nr:SPOR domain-containing protein [Bdellovibrionales bacterium]USN47327.1 MAG: SPOR domain-containing protein [Pseudobdellovibrionaceae bacterium]